METGECEKLAAEWGVPSANVPTTCAFVAALTALKNRLAPGVTLDDLPPELLDLVRKGRFADAPKFLDLDVGIYELPSAGQSTLPVRGSTT